MSGPSAKKSMDSPSPLDDLAVVIPIAKGDSAWVDLLLDLLPLPRGAEIVMVSPESSPQPHALRGNLKWIESPQGRAKQLNRGAASAEKPYLWFLHADSRLKEGNLASLERSIRNRPSALHYFNLAFSADGPSLTRINALGVWVRSHVLGIPFGDQGFCVSAQVFRELGGFREDAPYGEDHLFVWKARSQGIRLKCTGDTLFTSARKYRDQGWLMTTLKHSHLTWKQALPEAMKRIQRKS